MELHFFSFFPFFLFDFTIHQWFLHTDYFPCFSFCQFISFPHFNDVPVKPPFLPIHRHRHCFHTFFPYLQHNFFLFYFSSFFFLKSAPHFRALHSPCNLTKPFSRASLQRKTGNLSSALRHLVASLSTCLHE